ncbi:MAG: hypothetical protein AB1742_02080 [bacterium]
MEKLKPCNEKIQKALGLARELMILADEGDEARDDDSCGVLYGVIRDSAYRIKEQAEKEKKKHQDSGKWG